ncbi:response regulator [Labrenzia sp. PHM005]|uniref:response regulator n=1 Tax=Labrenzia sp. PHM005 TaxID=2590016 RepID=UPI00114084EF|nr:response regulator [Labrenzia sp. PHM005]QDG78097.1 response regulator [Labrenzia sp. PHM005]
MTSVRGPWDLSNISCLIVEDNPHMRTIIRSVVTGFGVRTVFEATEGAEALELVVDRKPDIVLCDWVMNLFGGADFLKILRRDPDPIVNTTPVLVITAHARRPVILEALNIGIHGFIAKPVSPAILYKHIGDVLQRQEMQGRCKGISLQGEPIRSTGDKVDLTKMTPELEPDREEASLALL